MASSPIEIQSDSTKQIEPIVADPTQISTNTVTINNIFTASAFGDLEKLRKFVEQDGVSLSSCDNNGWYALHWAAKYNHTEIAQYIIEHGGDVNAVTNTQETALHCATMAGSISIADLLLHNGANVEAANANGNRAVHFAAGNGQTPFLTNIVEKHNADFDVPDNYKMSPLHWAASYGQVDTTTWLLSKKASLKRQDIHGHIPLVSAAMYRHMDAFRVLLDAYTEQGLLEYKGTTANQLVPYLTSMMMYEECKNSSICPFGDIPEGTNRPMIIAMQGDAYTGKTHLARILASWLNCLIIHLDDFLEASDHTNEKDTLVSNAFNIIAQIVNSQISLGNSVIIDSPLSRLSHLQKLARVVHNKSTKLMIIECKPVNEYAYQLKFEETGSKVYANSWYKPKTAWPLPKVPRNYTDDKIPSGVSKLVFDTHDFYDPCRLLEAVFDVASCSYGHKTIYNENWVFIHTDKKEQFICPHCKMNPRRTNKDLSKHMFNFHDDGDHSDTLSLGSVRVGYSLCGVCDILVDGPRYACMDCPLILHKSCAEVDRDENKHFVPETFPISMSSDPHLMYSFPVERPCAECSKDGKDFSHKCNNCLFESHLKSRLVPTIVRHKVITNVLTLWFNSEAGNCAYKYLCAGCMGECYYVMYHAHGGLYFHPECALLPPSIAHSHGGYTHDLEMIMYRAEKEEDYVCDRCPNKMDPLMWYYYCSECNISLHLKCAFLDFDSE